MPRQRPVASDVCTMEHSIRLRQFSGVGESRGTYSRLDSTPDALKSCARARPELPPAVRARCPRVRGQLGRVSKRPSHFRGLPRARPHLPGKRVHLRARAIPFSGQSELGNACSRGFRVLVRSPFGLGADFRELAWPRERVREREGEEPRLAPWRLARQ